MSFRKRSLIPPDFLDAIVEETQTRILEQRMSIPVDYHHAAAMRAAENAAPTLVRQRPARRSTIATRIVFLVIMAIVLTLSVGFSIGLGLSVAGLVIAFTILPISAPFFLLGGVVAIALFFLFRFIGRLSGRAAQKADYIRAQKELRRA